MIAPPPTYKKIQGPYITDNRTPFVNDYNQKLWQAAASEYNYYKKLMTKYEGEYKQAFNEAKDANESRYAEILGGFDNLYSDTMTGLEGMGDAAKKDVNTGYNKAFSQSMQGLINAGMANSTIVPSVSLNNSRQRTDALNSLNEMLRREKLGYMNNITGNKLSFMERREDTYPDAGLYSSLMNQAGQGLGNVTTPKYMTW